MKVVKYSKRRLPVTPIPSFRLAALLVFLAVPIAASAQTMGGTDASSAQRSQLTTLDPFPPETGWQSLANLLDRLKPSVDTRLVPTPSQVTDHIEKRINAGDNEAALDMILKREAELAGKPGTDVQLMFQHARVLAALGRTQESIDLYTEMTTRFPELPEPWNNLGALQAARGETDQAREAISMALRANPDYADAKANLRALDAKSIAAPAGKPADESKENPQQ